MIMKFRIFRYDPDKDDEPYYQSYEVEASPKDRILDCLNRIRAEKDSTLSFRMSCGHGVCGSDGMRINGTSALACQKLVKDFDENEEILIEPLQVFRVVKDLVVDMEPFFERYYSVKPYLITKPPIPKKSGSSLLMNIIRSRMPSAASCAPAAQLHARSTRINRLKRISVLQRLSALSGTFSIRGMKARKRGLPCLTIRTGLGDARPNGCAQKCVPRRYRSQKRFSRSKNGYLRVRKVKNR